MNSFEFEGQNEMVEELRKFNLGTEKYEEFQKKYQLLTGIYYNQLNMIRRAKQLLACCTDMKQSLQKKSKTPPFLVKQTKLVKSNDEKQLQFLSSKLSVLALKSQKQRYFESQYFYSTMVRKMQNVLEYLQIQNFEQVRNMQIWDIKKHFKIVTRKVMKKHKYYEFIDLLYPFEDPAIAFYIDLQIPEILYSNSFHLPFNANILFCPIIIENNAFTQDGREQKTTLSIYSEYLKQLTMIESNWDNFSMTIVVFKNNRPYLYATRYNQIYDLFVGRNRIWRVILKVREYVYLIQIKKWLWSIYRIQQQSDLYIKLSAQFKIKISSSKDNHSLPETRNKKIIFEELFNFCCRKDHYQYSRKELKKKTKQSFCLTLTKLQAEIANSYLSLHDGKYLYKNNKMIRIIK